MNINAVRNALYTNYNTQKSNIFRKYGALNPDGTVNKKAPGYKAAVKEIEPYHKQMMDRAREIGGRREQINQQIYEEAGVKKPQMSGTDPSKGGGRGAFGDAEGTAGSVRDYDRIAKGFENKGYHVDRQPDYIKVEELDTVIHRPAGPSDTVGGSAHEARVAAQGGGPETAGSAKGQNKYQGQGGEYAGKDDMGAGLDSIKKMQDAVNEKPQTPWERYQRDQIIAKETNRLRESAGMGKDPVLERVKEGADPDLMADMEKPVKENALRQARSSWLRIEERQQLNMEELDQAIKNAENPRETHRLMAERNNILRRQEATRKAIRERDGGKAFRRITGKDISEKPQVAKGLGNTDEEKPPSAEGSGFWDKHPIERRLKPLLNGKPGKVTQFMESHGGKITLALSAVQLLNCLHQGKTIVQCATELAEGFAVGSATVVVLGPTGATILAGAAGSYQIYGAGVEATRQWTDRQQRLAIYENRERQTTINLENIDQYINDFKEKRIYGELKRSADSISKACRNINVEIQRIREGKDGMENILRLEKQLNMVERAARRCRKVKPLADEIADLRNKIKYYEEKTIKGFEWAQAHVVDCRNEKDAAKIKKIFNDSTGLAAKIKGFSIQAHMKNKKIAEAVSSGRSAIKVLDQAHMTVDRFRADAEAVRTRLSSIRQRIAKLGEKKKRHSALTGSILSEIDRLRGAFPDKLLPGNEKKFGVLRHLVDKFRTPVCRYAISWLDRNEIKDKKHLSTFTKNAESALKKVENDLSVCRDINSADQDLEDIDTSANWVLTAVGMNEDLPQRVDKCLAKSKPTKEHLLARAKCPDNSRPYWNKKLKRVKCRCLAGYHVPDNNTKICVEVDKAAAVAKADCSKYPHSRPYWNEKEHRVKCTWCPKGYKWRDRHGNKCVVDKAAQVAKADCSRTPNSRPYWDDKHNSVRCRYCKSGYHWRNSSSLDCVQDKHSTQNGGGGHIDFGSIFEQINSANQRHDEEVRRINKEWNAERRRAEQQRAAQREQRRREEARRLQRARAAQQAAARARIKRQQEIENLRRNLSDTEKNLRCLEEGKRKYPGHWLDCNGHWTLRSRDMEIANLRRIIRNDKARLRKLSAGRK